ncbi:MAG: cell shape-determining protein MreB [Cytophagales bacterium]|nr:MAG: cell shape-determining protein MreB [Cytophagales bacterium]
MQSLKNWQYSLLLLLTLSVAFVACNNDDEPAPVLSITNVSPTTAPLNGTLTITGTEFGATPESNTVTFGGNAVATVLTASPTQLVVRVPATAQNGAVTVKTGTQTATSTQQYQIGAREVVPVSGSITANTTWSADKIYVLRGYVLVDNNAVLTIQPGTIIKGAARSEDPSGGQRAASLIIRPGAKIEARGTAQAPIVFTSNQPAGQRARGDWGGLIIHGKAPHNREAARNLEGDLPGPMGTFNEPTDNSGTLQYVRIEFPGIAITANNEINGLTLYGVGSGTTINYIQVSYGGDDAYEWFGGSVNAKYLVAYRTFDDDWDTDWGFTGKVQYAVSLRDPNVADVSGSNGFESDNFNNGFVQTPAANAGLPQTAPVFANVSNFAFSGAPSTANAPGGSGPYQSAMHLRRNTAISIFNSLFVGYPEGLRLDSETSVTYASTLDNATAERMQLRGIVLANTGVTSSSTAIPLRGFGSVTNAQAQAFFNTAAFSNQVVASADIATLLLNTQSFNLTGTPNFLPQAGSPLLTGGVRTGKLASDTFFDNVTFRGAFGTTDWTLGWCNWDPINTPYN